MEQKKKKAKKKKLDWGKHLARSNGTTSLHGNPRTGVKSENKWKKTRVVMGEEGECLPEAEDVQTGPAEINRSIGISCLVPSSPCPGPV